MYPFEEYHQYTDYHLEPAGVRRLDFFVRAIDAWVADHPGVTPMIVDAGCGNGNIALPLASKGWSVKGIDVDAQSIAVAEKRNTFANTQFIVADAKVALARIHPDIIIASELIEHLPDPLAFLRTVVTALNADGLLLGSIPFGYSVEELIRWSLQRTRMGCGVKHHLRKTMLPHEAIQTHAESPHLQYFTWGRFARVLRDANCLVHERRSTSVFFKEFFYLFGRLFMTRGSRTFQVLDTVDNALANYLPFWMGDGWLFAARKKV